MFSSVIIIVQELPPDFVLGSRFLCWIWHRKTEGMLGQARKDWPTLWLLPQRLQDPSPGQARGCQNSQGSFPWHWHSDLHSRREIPRGAIGSVPFLTGYFKQKVEEWTEEVKTLSGYAKTQPHAAYAAFTHGLSSKWNYLLRIVDVEALSASDLLLPLESAICSQLIPALTRQNLPGDLVRELTALPVRLGGLSLINVILCTGTWSLKEDYRPTGGTGPTSGSQTDRLPYSPETCQSKSTIYQKCQSVNGRLETAERVPGPHAALHGTCTGERNIILVVCTARLIAMVLLCTS